MTSTTTPRQKFLARVMKAREQSRIRLVYVSEHAHFEFAYYIDSEDGIVIFGVEAGSWVEPSEAGLTEATVNVARAAIDAELAEEVL